MKKVGHFVGTTWDKVTGNRKDTDKIGKVPSKNSEEEDYTKSTSPHIIQQVL